MSFEVFEKHPDVDAYRFGPSFTPYAIVAKEKRFTAPELLAQYWFCEKMGHSPIFNAVLWRFATMPHHDEFEEKTVTNGEMGRQEQ